VLFGYLLSAIVPALLSLSLLRAGGSAVRADATLRRKYGATLCIPGWHRWRRRWSGRMEVFFLERYGGAGSGAVYHQLSMASLATQAQCFFGAFLPISRTLRANDLQTIHRTFASGTRLMAFMLFRFALCGVVTPVCCPALWAPFTQPCPAQQCGGWFA